TPMIKKHKYDILVILSLITLGVSLYLSITHYLGFAVPCDFTHGCEEVLHSKYSMFLGLPLAVYGVTYSLAVIVTALLANHYAFWRKTLTLLLCLGALASLGFLSIQFFVLKKVCQYCLTVDVLNIVLLILDLNIEHKSIDKI
ncbi:MAG TPA: vitamin K epoxide reductase family protein, partial [Candidatus Limnocylindria bacterium]|nr:vitamin K epoxide reductase family protein [Candidatus Limnocylindria bacterium]